MPHTLAHLGSGPLRDIGTTQDLKPLGLTRPGAHLASHRPLNSTGLDRASVGVKELRGALAPTAARPRPKSTRIVTSIVLMTNESIAAEEGQGKGRRDSSCFS